MTTFTTLTPAFVEGGLEQAGLWFGAGDGVPISGGNVNIFAARFGPIVLPPGRLLKTATFSLRFDPGPASPLYVSVPTHPASAGAWSNSNLPSRYRLGLAAEVHPTSTAFQTVTVTLNMDLVQTVVRRVGWDTYLPLVVTRDRWTGALEVTFSSGNLTLTYPSGADDVIGDAPSLPGGLDRHARPDMCPRCGTAGFRDEWVRDGYRGVLVCASCYDPPEPERTPAGPRDPLVNG